jgi:hypothetical protein
MMGKQTNWTGWLRAHPGFDAGLVDAPSRSSVIRRSAPNTTTTGVDRPTPRHIIRVTTHEGPPPARRIPARTEKPQTRIRAVATHNKRGLLANRSPLFYLVSICTLLLLGWWLISALVHWVNVTLDDWHYGRPRTYQTDADVGHGGMSHFTAQNLDGQIYIFEIRRDDPTKSRLYGGPAFTGSEASLTVATIAFKDVNGDGLLDLMVLVGGQQVQILLNTGDGFRKQEVERNI